MNGNAVDLAEYDTLGENESGLCIRYWNELVRAGTSRDSNLQLTNNWRCLWEMSRLLVFVGVGLGLHDYG